MKPSVIAIALIAAALGWLAAHFTGGLSKPSGDSTRKVLFYQSPMHPWVKSNQPGKCTICGMDLVPVHEGDAGFDQVASGIVMLPQGSPNVVGVQTSEVRKQPLARTLRIAGMIGEDMSRHGIISAPVEGRIDGLAMNHEGQQVTRRQPLATIFSRTLLNVANDYNTALKQSPESALLVQRRLEQYGLVWEQIKSIPQRQPDDLYFGILSTLTGVIVKSYIAEGEYVKEGQKLFEIADFTRMWFMFNASEQDLPLLKIGQIVTLSAPHLPGQTLKSRIAAISPNLEAMSRSAMVRVVLENPDRTIKNNTFAEGTVELEAPEVITIPRAAVLWPGNSPRVFVEMAAGTYQQRNVKLGRSGDALWEILDGLKEGDRIVTSGNMLIDSQAQINALAKPAGLAPVEASSMTGDSAALRTWFKAVATLNLALASDDLAAANAALKHLSPAPNGLVKTAAPVPGTDLKTMRQAFLPWSQETAALAVKLKSRIPDLHIFRCSMTHDLWPGAPANAGWIQLTTALRNPYWGKEMLECGMEVKP
jgi:Cu(I)/Ag(I) efflux system membrane fusion protein